MTEILTLTIWFQSSPSEIYTTVFSNLLPIISALKHKAFAPGTSSFAYPTLSFPFFVNPVTSEVFAYDHLTTKPSAYTLAHGGM